MPYTPEMFNRYNQRVEESRNAVCRHIMYLLRPADGYPKGSDVRLKELYDSWRADCRAMDAALQESIHLASRQEMIEMPPDDGEHSLCRRMAAVVIEQKIFGEHNAQHYLPDLVEQMKLSTCYTHPYTCACHYHLGNAGWTYNNYDLLCTLSASYEEKEKETERQARLARLEEPAVGGGPLIYKPAMGGGRPVRVACAGWRDCTCGGCSGGGPPSEAQQRSQEHVTECACGACHRFRVENGTQEAYEAKLRAETNKVLGAAHQADNAIAAAKAMPGGKNQDGFAKNLFQTVQGVKYDAKCPHSLPFYACMSCSH